LKILTLTVILLLIVFGVFFGGYLFSMGAQQVVVDVSMSSDASLSETMWVLHIPNLGARGESFVGYVESGTTDSGMEFSETLRIEISGLETMTVFPQSHHQLPVASLDFDYDALFTWDQIAPSIWYEDIYTYDYGYTTTTYSLKIFSGDTLVVSEIVPYGYRELEWITIPLTGYSDGFVRNGPQTNNGVVTSVSNVQYFETEDRTGTLHSYTTREGSINSLVSAWDMFLDQVNDDYGGAIVGGGITDGTLGMIARYNWNPTEYGDLKPIIDDWNSRLPSTNMWTALCWGDIHELFGVQNYNEYPEMHQINIDGVSVDVDTYTGYLNVSYYEGQIGQELYIYLPLDVADIVTWEAASCDASPTLNSLSLNNSSVQDEGGKVVLTANITNNGAETCIFDINVQGGNIVAFRETDVVFQPGETRDVTWMLTMPDLAMDAGESQERGITVQVTCGMGCQSELKTVYVTIQESSPQTSEWEPGVGETTVDVLGFDFPLWIVIIIVALVFAVILWLLLGRRRSVVVVR